MHDLKCKECGADREIGRRLCKPCNSARLLKHAYNRPRYTWSKNCMACSNVYEASRKEQLFCSDCHNHKLHMKEGQTASNTYEATKVPGKHVHRRIAEEILGRTLKTDEVVHHVDENTRHNEPSNLLVMSRIYHGKLHAYLDNQRVIIEKSMNDNQGNCWDTLRVPMTTAWLEMTGAKVIKLSEIGQSAAESLKEKSYAEGSET